MTFKEIEKQLKGVELPAGGTNENGETFIVEAGCRDGVRFYHITTAQNNNWVRHNYIYEDYTSEELFER